MNQAYFDTYNLHHYVGFDKYPSFYASHRAVSAGRSMWVTECNTPVQWADEKTKEPSDSDLRVQARCVAKIFALSLHEGSRNTFYFMLPHYVEHKTQYGILHEDLTPRPAFMALAAVGRALAGAKPLGRLQEDAKIHAYLFKTKNDGRDLFTLVAWRDDGESVLHLNTPIEKVIDHLGRDISGSWVGELKISPSPVFAILPIEPKALPLDAPATQPSRHEQSRSAIVLQMLRPPTGISLNRSALVLPPDQQHQLKLHIYNFSEQPAEGTLTITSAVGATLSTTSVSVDSHGRAETTIAIPARQPSPDRAQQIRITGPQNATLSFRIADADKKQD